MPLICVFTPTYNRAQQLNRIYESLLGQSFKDFEWLIVDDGSTDNTEAVVADFQTRSPFKISYFFKENGGKQRATNFAVEKCTCPLFFGLDSDDYLTTDALECTSRAWSQIKDEPDVAGFIALRGYDVDTPLGSWMPSGIHEANSWDLYYELGFTGDASQVYKTEILKNHPYPVIDGEKFISECIVQYAIAQEQKMLLINKVLVLGSYLDGGLTDKSFSLIRDCPNGYILVKEQSVDMAKRLSQKIYHMSLCLAAYRFAHRRYQLTKSRHKLLFLLSWIPSWVCYLIIYFS